ncbi:GntR family transcriptional regulator [Streptomyces andamanensis]|uniref:GntR family transcriptional regulator n=1 Tax=Streptomyces andamanensis TaxID=1565035 RepID=A0ABV8TCK5_9ACTN
MLQPTRELHERLRRSILRGDWPKGSRGPALRDLIDIHGLNRSQATLVLEELAREGLIVRVQGTGPVIAYTPGQGRAEP